MAFAPLAISFSKVKRKLENYTIKLKAKVASPPKPLYNLNVPKSTSLNTIKPVDHDLPPLPAEQEDRTPDVVPDVHEPARIPTARSIPRPPSCPGSATPRQGITSMDLNLPLPKVLRIGNETYKFHYELGSGSFGTVMHATTSQQTSCAVKVLYKPRFLLDSIPSCEDVGSEHSHPRVGEIVNEVHILKKISLINCPYLGQTKGVYQNSNFVFYIMVSLSLSSINTQLTDLG